MQEMGSQRGLWLSRGATLAAGLALVAWATPASATAVDPDPPADVTFTRDVAPILQENCQVCHSPGSIAPMSLMTYDEVRPWARVIKLRVENRKMPPFLIDSSVGIQEFKNDRRLSDEEIATIAAWVDAGAPEGDPADMPAPKTFANGTEWLNADDFGRPPDLVVQTTPYDIAATGQDAWWRPTVDTGLTEARWVKGVEVKPTIPGRQVTHHVLATLIQDEPGAEFHTAGSVQDTGGLLTEWSIGKVGEIYPDNTGKLMLPGSKIRFEVHYNPGGEEVLHDQVSLGLWFYPEGQSPKYRTTLNLFSATGDEFTIPPNTVATHQDFHVMKDPVRLESFQPHMHMRGKGMSMEAIYPNGKRELLSAVTNFDWRWQNNYIYDQDVAPLLPAGTVLVFTAWHDNTDANPFNPDPNQFVTYGDRTVDEMAHAWVAVTHLTQEDFDKLVAEREAATGKKLAFDSGTPSRN